MFHNTNNNSDPEWSYSTHYTNNDTFCVFYDANYRIHRFCPKFPLFLDDRPLLLNYNRLSPYPYCFFPYERVHLRHNPLIYIR